MPGPSLAVVIPSYASGASILPTLNSLHKSVRAWSDESYTLVLSDSSPDHDICVQVRGWSAQVGCTLVIDHSDQRRIIKEALNVAFSKKEVATADIVIVTNDDVVVDVNCISEIVRALSENADAVIAVGCVLPDPLHATGRRSAGAWQMELVTRIARYQGPNVFRSEGALWGTRGQFAGNYRHPIGSGNIADDVELRDFVKQSNLGALNVHQAVVYKIPASGFSEFALQTHRSQFSLKTSNKVAVARATKLRAIAQGIIGSPRGASKYFAHQLCLLAGAGKRDKYQGELGPRARYPLIGHSSIAPFINGS